MLRLLGLDNNPAAVALIGVVLLAIGLVIHGVLIVVIGGALIVWGGIGALRRSHRGAGGR